MDTRTPGEQRPSYCILACILVLVERFRVKVEVEVEVKRSKERTDTGHGTREDAVRVGLRVRGCHLPLCAPREVENGQRPVHRGVTPISVSVSLSVSPHAASF